MSNEERVRALHEEAGLLENLGHRISEGEPMLEAIRAAGKSYPRFEEAFLNVHDVIRDGDSFADGFVGHEKLFQDFVPGMIDVAEETGEMNRIPIVVAGIIRDMAKLVQRGGDPSRVKIAEMLDYWMLAELLDVGLPLTRSLEILGKNSRSRNRTIWLDSIDSIRRGRQLGEVMRDYREERFPKEDAARLLAAERVMTDADVSSPDSRVEVLRSIAERLKGEIFH